MSSIRQASIPISVLIGGFLLKETNVLKRLNWSLVLALGIVLIIVSEYVYTSGALINKEEVIQEERDSIKSDNEPKMNS